MPSKVLSFAKRVATSRTSWWILLSAWMVWELQALEMGLPGCSALGCPPRWKQDDTKSGLDGLYLFGNHTLGTKVWDNCCYDTCEQETRASHCDNVRAVLGVLHAMQLRAEWLLKSTVLCSLAVAPGFGRWAASGITWLWSYDFWCLGRLFTPTGAWLMVVGTPLAVLFTAGLVVRLALFLVRACCCALACKWRKRRAEKERCRQLGAEKVRHLANLERIFTSFAAAHQAVLAPLSPYLSGSFVALKEPDKSGIVAMPRDPFRITWRGDTPVRKPVSGVTLLEEANLLLANARRESLTVAVRQLDLNALRCIAMDVTAEEAALVYQATLLLGQDGIEFCVLAAALHKALLYTGDVDKWRTKLMGMEGTEAPRADQVVAARLELLRRLDVNARKQQLDPATLEGGNVHMWAKAAAQKLRRTKGGAKRRAIVGGVVRMLDEDYKRALQSLMCRGYEDLRRMRLAMDRMDEVIMNAYMQDAGMVTEGRTQEMFYEQVRAVMGYDDDTLAGMNMRQVRGFLRGAERRLVNMGEAPVGRFGAVLGPAGARVMERLTAPTVLHHLDSWADDELDADEQADFEDYENICPMPRCREGGAAGPGGPAALTEEQQRVAMLISAADSAFCGQAPVGMPLRHSVIDRPRPFNVGEVVDLMVENKERTLQFLKEAAPYSTAKGKAAEGPQLPKAPKRRAVKVKEGPIPGKTTLMPAAVYTEIGGVGAQGYAYRENDALVLVVQRHHQLGEMGDHLKPKQQLLVHCYWRPEPVLLEVHTLRYYVEDDDRLGIVVKGVAPNDPSYAAAFKEVAPRVVCSAGVQAGDPITLIYYDVGKKKFLVSVGSLKKVGATTVHYDAVTAAGFCRAPVYTASGLLAGHLFTEQGLNGGHVELAAYTIMQKPQAAPTKPLIAHKQGHLMKLPYTVGKRHADARLVKLPREEYTTTDVDLMSVRHSYVYGAGGPDDLMLEVHKFADTANCVVDLVTFHSAWATVVEQELDTARPFVNPGAEGWKQLVTFLAEESPDKSAGQTGRGGKGTHLEALKDLGGEAGLEGGIAILAARMHALFNYLTEGDPDLLTKEVELALFNLRVWRVQPKKDRYKLKKVQNGFRSIQAPSMEMKLMWLALMRESDISWNALDGYAVGEDMAGPVRAEVLKDYARATKVISTDMTGYDRRIPQQMLQAFFNRYVRRMCHGVPPAILDVLYTATVESHLAMPDGTVYLKLQGNPSGFPNTLRLNSVILRVAELCVAHEATKLTMKQLCQARRVEICGDDSRVWLLDDIAAASVDPAVLNTWNSMFSWEVKVEGYNTRVSTDTDLTAWLEAAPPLVSRNLVVDHRGVVWNAMHDPNRTLSKLWCASPQDEHYVERLEGTLVALQHWVVWHAMGYAYVPSLDVVYRHNKELYEKAQNHCFSLMGGYVEDVVIRGGVLSSGAIKQKRVLQGGRIGHDAPTDGRLRAGSLVDGHHDKPQHIYRDTSTFEELWMYSLSMDDPWWENWGDPDWEERLKRATLNVEHGFKASDVPWVPEHYVFLTPEQDYAAGQGREVWLLDVLFVLWKGPQHFVGHPQCRAQAVQVLLCMEFLGLCNPTVWREAGWKMTVEQFRGWYNDVAARPIEAWYCPVGRATPHDDCSTNFCIYQYQWLEAIFWVAQRRATGELRLQGVYPYQLPEPATFLEYKRPGDPGRRPYRLLLTELTPE